MTLEFGATAWGRAWLKEVEPVLITGAPNRDLPRARALARHGVEEVTIEGPHVRVRLTERGQQRTITLDIPTWNSNEQRIAARVVGSTEPSHGGDLPDELVSDLTSAGVRLAPHIVDIRATSDLGKVSRRHVLAACYALVQRIDEQPILAIGLRTPPGSLPRSQDIEPAGLLSLDDIDPTTFYLTVDR